VKLTAHQTALTCTITLVLFLLTACVPAPKITTNISPEHIQFNGEAAFELQTEFATTFNNRDSGTATNKAAAEWVMAKFQSVGWDCHMDEWSVVLYSEDVPLRNAVCTLPGLSEQQILVVAHHDQAPETIEGADNDASGISIMLEMAKNFAAEKPLPYSLVFVSTDAEEWGMLGTLRYVQTHPDRQNIIAGMSLDNLGHPYYSAIRMELLGQRKGYGPIWLALTSVHAAQAVDSKWQVHLPPLADQIIGQAAPISYMDQGPMVRYGIPAVGFTGVIPDISRSNPDSTCLENPQTDNYRDLNYQLWHSPEDTMQCESADILQKAGVVAESLIRQLLSMQAFPQESGPYVYLVNKDSVLRGLPLYLIFIGFTALFFMVSVKNGGRSLRELKAGWVKALPNFLSLWLPLIASVLLLYVFVKIGVIEDFELYPSTTKEPYLLDPKGNVIALFLAGTAVFFFISRWLMKRGNTKSAPEFKQSKSLAMLVMGLVGTFMVLNNPFSLFFMLPMLFWFLIAHRPSKFGRALDIIFFLLGGLVIYAMVYVQGFLNLRYDFGFLWMLMLMVAVQTFSFIVMLICTAITAAGLSMVIKPSHNRS
jgi:hypothetical protein